MMKKIMKRAWEIAREGVKKFGGKVKEYFAEALKLAWKEVKEAVSLPALKGTPKQVAWAEDLRKTVMTAFEIAKEAAFETKYGQTKTDRLQNVINYLENEVFTQESAKFFIDHFQNVNARKVKKYANVDYEYSNVEISYVFRTIDLYQFAEDYRAKGNKFAKGFQVLESVMKSPTLVSEKMEFIKNEIN